MPKRVLYAKLEIDCPIPDIDPFLEDLNFAATWIDAKLGTPKIQLNVESTVYENRRDMFLDAIEERLPWKKKEA